MGIPFFFFLPFIIDGRENNSKSKTHMPDTGHQHCIQFSQFCPLIFIQYFPFERQKTKFSRGY